MKRLRHPIRALREPFGTAGLIVACVALIAALGGTALAANAALSGKQKKEVEKIAKKFAGQPGANGANGSPGAKGDPGSAGASGSPGAAGKSIVTSTAAVPAECPTGTTGTKFTVEGSATSSHVCSGKNGATGFTETLPPNKTEKGTWGVEASAAGSYYASISFPIPLASALDSAHVHYVKVAETPPTGCAGGTAAEPTAEPGNLCIYGAEELELAAALIKNPGNGELEEAGPAGVLLLTAFSEFGEAFGTWAVTAE